MKALQINAEVNLTSGLTIPSGAVVIILEGYADIKNQKLTDGEYLIPAQISTAVWASKDSYESGKSNVTGIADFNPVFSSLEMTYTAYSTETAEQLLINTVEDALIAIYGTDNVIEINVTPIQLQAPANNNA